MRVRIPLEPPLKLKGLMDNEGIRALRVEQRKILGDYYRELSANYNRLWYLKLSWVWPDRPNIPASENL